MARVRIRGPSFDTPLIPAKEPRMAAKKRKASADQESAQDAAVNEGGAAVDSAAAPATGEDVAGRFVGQWNRLVSTTNWEKGRIICQWREALELACAAVTEYSDDAWAQLVGGVTSQHVGRLRRVFQQFGAVFDQYEGLYWSHFQAALDWNDAEMWLEGAILQNWSVSQMRGKRWETLGNAGDPPQDAAVETDEDAAAPFDDGEAASAAGNAPTIAAPPESRERTIAEDDDSESDSAEDDAPFDSEPASAPSPAKARKPLSVDVDDLPSDLADAFEQFKLAIISQRRTGWRETTPEAVIECLDALRELALAPADE
jgi:hypothetical protein